MRVKFLAPLPRLLFRTHPCNFISKETRTSLFFSTFRSVFQKESEITNTIGKSIFEYENSIKINGDFSWFISRIKSNFPFFFYFGKMKSHKLIFLCQIYFCFFTYLTNFSIPFFQLYLWYFSDMDDRRIFSLVVVELFFHGFSNSVGVECCRIKGAFFEKFRCLK